MSNIQEEIDHLRWTIQSEEHKRQYSWEWNFASDNHIQAVIIGLDKAAGEHLQREVGLQLVRELTGYDRLVSRKSLSTDDGIAIIEWLYGAGVKDLRTATLRPEAAGAVKHLVGEIKARLPQKPVWVQDWLPTV